LVRIVSSYWRDSHWWLALLLGPAVWYGLSWFIPLSTDDSFTSLSLWFIVQWLVLYPVLEELVFRAGLQSWCLRKWPLPAWYGLSLANGLTSLVFCLMHGLLRQWETALLVLLPSLVFGYFRDRTAGITASILLHCFYNAGFLYLFVPF